MNTPGSRGKQPTADLSVAPAGQVPGATDINRCWGVRLVILDDSVRAPPRPDRLGAGCLLCLTDVRTSCRHDVGHRRLGTYGPTRGREVRAEMTAPIALCAAAAFVPV